MTSKNIILLSDGTGNSSVAVNKTNVWRLYQALDLSERSQIAVYDDGVGTSGFRPLQLLGGAFGWGFSRNVRDLYTFLCRHYRDGDRIYIFGFSRGAFTARTLADMVVNTGILDPNKKVPGRRIFGFSGADVAQDTEAGLDRAVRFAYKCYRRGYWTDRESTNWFLKLLSRIGGGVRNALFNRVLKPKEFFRQYALHHEWPDALKELAKEENWPERLNEHAPIEFVGVWDTVDAVGLPIDELSTVVDKAIYPFRFLDQNLSPLVRHAAHALAIDDERQTFHPVLWNEVGQPGAERIRQVWFAGMHANVGGSYPDDDLAHITLNWMIAEIQRTSALKFNAAELIRITQRARPSGKIYNSRSGASVYYRYKPRRIADLCNDRINQVHIEHPKIHHSVFERIADSRAGYAPAVLPVDYRVVHENGTVSDVTPTTYENDDDRKRRDALTERAQGHIWWRRPIYFMLLATTLAVLLLPYYLPPVRGAEPGDWAAETDRSALVALFPDFLQPMLRAVGHYLELIYFALLSIAAGFLPDVAGYWLDGWAQSPLWLTLVLALFGVFFFWRRIVVGNTQRLAEASWRHVKTLPVSSSEPWKARSGERFGCALRRNRAIQGVFGFIARYVFPLVVGVAVLAIVLSTGYRLIYHLPQGGAAVCAKWLTRPLPEFGQQVEAGAEPETTEKATAIDVPDDTDPASPAIGRKSRNVEKSSDDPESGNAEFMEEPADDGAKEPAVVGGVIEFDIRNPCFDTGRTVLAGRRYQVTVSNSMNWFDAGYAASHKGLDHFWRRLWPFALYLPTRRHLELPWFALVGEIGLDSGEIFPIMRAQFTFTARATGRLYLYVNDAINVTECKIPVDCFCQADEGFPGPDERYSEDHLGWLEQHGLEPTATAPPDCATQDATDTRWFAPYLNNYGTAQVSVTVVDERHDTKDTENGG